MLGGKKALYRLGGGLLTYILFSNMKQNIGMNGDKFQHISTNLGSNMKLKGDLENKARVIKNQLENIRSQMNNIDKNYMDENL